MAVMNMRFNIFILVVIGLISVSTFTVYETEKAIVSQLGKLQVDNKTHSTKIYNPGLHFKLPFIQQIYFFDNRLSLLDIQSSRITTTEKKDVLVDFYVLWQINDLSLYYTRTGGNKNKAELLLQQKVVAAVKAEFGRHTIKDIVHGERLLLMERLKKSTYEGTHNMGISIADIRVKRIDLPDEVRDSVYERMKAERSRVATETIATGRAEAMKILSKARKTEKIILAESSRESKKIRGDGDAQALTVYANEYKKNPEFYEFYRSMQAYKNIFDQKNDVLIIKPDSDFCKYFNNSFK